MARNTRFIALVAALLVFSGCARNASWRTNEPADCAQAKCDTTFIEQHDRFDLTYVEFSERGNVFDRPRLNRVLEHINALAQGPRGVTAVVFVHGWKHNASDDDKNVKSFRRVLHAVTEDQQFRKQLFGTRRLVGVYAGWRGRSINLSLVEQLTYWDRKAVAQEVGKGGVTEMLLRLRHATLGSKTHGALRPNNTQGNSFLVVGHSFGGAIVLSALNEVLLQQLITAQPWKAPAADCPGNPDAPCVKAEPFAHGVVLLNPAIEANQTLQLREMATRYRYPDDQIKMMHVISTDGDTATSIAFPAGQWLGVNLSSRQTDLNRTYGGKPVTLREEELDTTTVGNFIPFRTARLEADDDAGSWTFEQCRKGNCGLSDEQKNTLIPTAENNPLVFISTDERFMKDHNDVFNCNVAAYLAAIVLDAQSRLLVAKRKPER